MARFISPTSFHDLLTLSSGWSENEEWNSKRKIREVGMSNEANLSSFFLRGLKMLESLKKYEESNSFCMSC